MLELTDLRKQYGEVTALDGCGFSVPSGHLVGFVGANGAGKTTTMRAIFGLVELDGGRVNWDGRPVGAAQRLRFGYMPEERGLYPRMQAADELVYFARLHGVGRAAAEARPKRCSSGSASQGAPARPSNSSHTGTSNASNSLPRSCTSPASWCSTSRSPGWTRWG